LLSGAIAIRIVEKKKTQPVWYNLISDINKRRETWRRNTVSGAGPDLRDQEKGLRVSEGPRWFPTRHAWEQKGYGTEHC